MPERERGDPKLRGLDIQSSQIAGFKAKWDAIDVDEYTVKGMQRLEKSQGTLFDHLVKRASAEGKEPKSQNCIGTGFTETYSIKLMKALGSLPTN